MALLGCGSGYREFVVPYPPCPDSDHDGYLSHTCGGEDCDDANETINPGVAEDCDTMWDDDCDGLANASDPDCGAACVDRGQCATGSRQRVTEALDARTSVFPS